MKRQTELPLTDAPAKDANVLVLSIRREHADRILSGGKRFELRKQLPKEPFGTVYLYESGGKGLVGCFRVTEAVRLPVEDLWRHVGELATTHERFREYFNGWAHGWAIGVGEYFRFTRSVSSVELRRVTPAFTAPQSYMLVRPHDALFSFLTALNNASGVCASNQDLVLRRLDEAEHRVYATLVQQEISQHYDDIDASFARANLATSALGSDPFALLTMKKDVLGIERIDGVLLGFTTLTYKHGGSVKSGPTVLFPEHRRRGYGLRVRSMVEEMLRKGGARKIYATAADAATGTLSYLLRSGMRIEAHLRAQYSKGHGELVLGKELNEATADVAERRLDSRPGHVVHSTDLTGDQAAEGLTLALSAYGVRVARERARQLARGLSLTIGYDRKPRELVVLRSGTSLVASIVLSAKRGGAMRGVLGSLTSHTPSLRRLVSAAEEIARASRRRKLYFLQSASDGFDIAFFKDRGYLTEGVLRAPYERGRDLVVLSLFLADGEVEA